MNFLLRYANMLSDRHCTKGSGSWTVGCPEHSLAKKLEFLPVFVQSKRRNFLERRKQRLNTYCSGRHASGRKHTLIAFRRARRIQQLQDTNKMPRVLVVAFSVHSLCGCFQFAPLRRCASKRYLDGKLCADAAPRQPRNITLNTLGAGRGKRRHA